VGDACTLEPGCPEINATQVRRSEVGVAEIDLFSVEFTQVQAAKISSRQINRTLFGPFEVVGILTPL
jgi:hypothetical protein